MCPQTSGSFRSETPEETQVQDLYQNFIEGWNQRDARKLASGFASDGMIIGFDGSQHAGPSQIQEQIAGIFQQHATPPFLAKVKDIRWIAPEVAQLQALVGMIPPQKTALDPKLHALQVMTAVRRQGRWMIALLQNTPAQLHGRPEAVEALTRELEELKK